MKKFFTLALTLAAILFASPISAGTPVADLDGSNGQYSSEETGRILSTRKPFVRRVAVMGDSLAAFNSLPDLDDVASNIQYEARGWLVWANMLLGGRMDFDTWRTSDNAVPTYGGNQAVGGETSTQALARLNAVIAVNPDAVVVHTGGNDLTGATTAATVISNLQAIGEGLLDNGITAVIAGVLPRDTSVGGDWASGGSARKERLTINEAMRQWCKLNAHRGAIYVDLGKYIVDPASADGNMYSWATYDGTHLTPKGAYFAGLATKEVFEPLVPTAPPFVSSSQEDVYDATYNTRGNYITNGLFTGTGGTKTGSNPATGTVADGWILEHVQGAANCVASLVARADVPGGYWQQLACTQTDSNLDLWYLRRADGSTALSTSKWYQGYINVEIDAGSDILVGAFMEAEDKGESVNHFSQYPYNLSGTTYTLPNLDLPTLTHKTPPFNPATGTGLRLRNRVYMKGTNGDTKTIRFGGAGLREVENPNNIWRQ